MAAEKESSDTGGGSSVWGVLTMAFVLVLGLSASYFLSRPMPEQARAVWNAKADADAERLASTFVLLLDHANSPLQSLATLFNGSGRVAADEFENTIDYLKGHTSDAFPESMGFLTKSQPSSCSDDDGCWMVAYSTDTSGVLRPGSDVSRFGPTITTINTALENENSLVIGSVFEGETGSPYSYYAVTIRNTRQFGVVVSLIDYESVVARMYDEWVPHGMRLRLEASFSNGGEMTTPRFIIGDEESEEGSSRSISVPAEIDGAQFNLVWDVTEDYAGGPQTLAGTFALYAGIFATLFLVLLIRSLFRAAG
ncbi:MAG: hypothetical protein GKS03_00225 [Alphaproteobacteria bacterium]|nr:hypothetical protein [Alphaproteobacteria bacterium]